MCLLAAPRVQLTISAVIGWLNLSISWQLRVCKVYCWSRIVTSELWLFQPVQTDVTEKARLFQSYFPRKTTWYKCCLPSHVQTDKPKPEYCRATFHSRIEEPFLILVSCIIIRNWTVCHVTYEFCITHAWLSMLIMSISGLLRHSVEFGSLTHFPPTRLRYWAVVVCCDIIEQCFHP